MAKYVKLTNGPIRFLVSEEDKATIKEKLALGFKPVKDKDGRLIYTDSKEIKVAEDNEVRDLLYGI